MIGLGIRKKEAFKKWFEHTENEDDERFTKEYTERMWMGLEGEG